MSLLLCIAKAAVKRFANKLGAVLNYLSKRDSEAFFVLAPNVGALGDAASAEKDQNHATNGD